MHLIGIQYPTLQNFFLQFPLWHQKWLRVWQQVWHTSKVKIFCSQISQYLPGSTVRKTDYITLLFFFLLQWLTWQSIIHLIFFLFLYFFYFYFYWIYYVPCTDLCDKVMLPTYNITNWNVPLSHLRWITEWNCKLERIHGMRDT